MEFFIAWLRATSLSMALQDQAPWLWPICETFHFIGLTLVIGVAGFFDLRLLGAMKRISFNAAKELMPWAMVGFSISLTTGMIFLISQPQEYAVKGAWWAKVSFLVIAGLNVLVFEKLLSPKFLTLEPEDDTPLSLKIVGLVSLACWFAVLYFGRMIPYLQPGLISNL